MAAPAAPVAAPAAPNAQINQEFSLANVGRSIQQYEYIISSIASAAIATAVALATGGSVTIGFVAINLLAGAGICFLNHHLSEIAIAITKIFFGFLHLVFSDQQSLNRFSASVETIESTTLYKTIRASINILSTVIPLAGLSGHLLGENVIISSAILAGGTILLRTGALPGFMTDSYRMHLQRQMIRRAVQQYDNNFFIALLRNNFFREDGYGAVVQNAIDLRFRQAQAQIGNSDQIINRVIDKYINDLGNDHGQPFANNLQEFQENLDASMPAVLQIIANETIIDIISSQNAPRMLRGPNYPSVILERDKNQLITIHRNFRGLPQAQQDEIKAKINNAEGPANPRAREIWTAIRGFGSTCLTQGNQIFNATVQRVIEQRQPPAEERMPQGLQA